MKLALIGGGGVRAPEFTRGALAMAAALDLRELWLMDSDGDRLGIIAPLCRQIAAGSGVDVRATTDLDEALRGAGAVVTTVRVGGEHGRVLDERIALRHGVLGQETTGAGGFAMAMRSIPTILHVAERAAELAPDAWLFNFTNPAGLVAQALADAGYERVVGICDSADHAQEAVAAWAGVSREAVQTEVYGLNHLSWTRAALIDGRDVLPDALADDHFLATTRLHLFDPELVRRKGAFFNEYLYYWYYRDVALRHILAETHTRGEQIEAMNKDLFARLRGLPPAEAAATYEAYTAQRNSTYMSYAEQKEQPPPTPGAITSEGEDDTAWLDDAVDGAHASAGPSPQRTEAKPAVGGYAGVALRALAALRGGEPVRMALNTPNGMALAALDAADVVEVTCMVGNGHIVPLVFTDALPEDDALLMQTVKRYERLAVEAVMTRSRATAVDALMAHPLVASYPLARALVSEYLEAHRDYVGEWR